MHPGTFAATDPERPAVIVEPGGPTVTYRELEERSQPGGTPAARTRPRHRTARRDPLPAVREYLELAWGAQRAGLYHVGINVHLTADEAAYIVRDSQADLIVAWDGHAGRPRGPRCSRIRAWGARGRLMFGEPRDDWESYAAAVAAQPLDADRRTRPRVTSCSIRQVRPGDPRASNGATRRRPARQPSRRPRQVAAWSAGTPSRGTILPCPPLRSTTPRRSSSMGVITAAAPS